MKKVSLFIIVAIIVTGFASCRKEIEGEGPVVTQLRSLENFREVSISIPGKLNYTIGSTYKVELIAQQNILNVIETKIIGDELLFKVKDNKNLKSHEEITVNITAPFADRINLSGSADVAVTGTITATNAEFRISGSGNINVEKIDLTNKLTGTISGSGNLLVRGGKMKSAELRLSGSGNFDLQQVAGEQATVEISGSGNTKINVTQTLAASISGSGSVYYKGNPQISTQISGSGRVQPL
jgi:hypothetical protein